MLSQRYPRCSCFWNTSSLLNFKLQDLRDESNSIWHSYTTGLTDTEKRRKCPKKHLRTRFPPPPSSPLELSGRINSICASFSPSLCAFLGWCFIVLLLLNWYFKILPIVKLEKEILSLASVTFLGVKVTKMKIKGTGRMREQGRRIS